MSEPIKIDVWSDIACPWCYIGKANLDAAIRGFDGPEVEIEYHSYELSPDTPIDFEGSEVDFLVGYKRISPDQARQMLARVTSAAANAGLTYDFDRLQHTRTLKAHELLHFAKEHGRQYEMSERLFRAYFSEGRHLGQVDELVDMAADAGLDPQAAREALEQGTYASDVSADIAEAETFGINAVPFFIFDGRYGLSGAQPPEVFASALGQLAAERADSAAR
ncbi:DsbA family protein [Smaragdicoccus niigatensis]|uniref:DsbA family oxidoreductase n=1 Tax=Smaragdicoccus niigatensis TaxID=359359 RepID=UPI00036451CA|nr:DsbA family oxidoreductase [Smaragdicoccus niigatensis]